MSFDKTSYLRKDCPALKAKRLTNGRLEVKFEKGEYRVYKEDQCIGVMHAISKQNFDIRKVFESNAGHTVVLETKTAADMVKDSIFTKLDILSHSRVEKQKTTSAPAIDGWLSEDEIDFDGWNIDNNNNTKEECVDNNEVEAPVKKAGRFGPKTPLFG